MNGIQSFFGGVTPEKEKEVQRSATAAGKDTSAVFATQTTKDGGKASAVYLHTLEGRALAHGDELRGVYLVLVTEVEYREADVTLYAESFSRLD